MNPWFMDLAFVDQLASQNNGVKYSIIVVDIFETCQSSNNENIVCKRHFTSFQYKDFSKNTSEKICFDFDK